MIIKPSNYIDIRSFLGNFRIVSLSTDQESKIIILSSHKDHNNPLENYRCIIINNDIIEIFNLTSEQSIPRLRWAHPMNDDRLLFVTPRSPIKQKNGRIFSKIREIERDIFLGDGIHSIQTTS